MLDRETFRKRLIQFGGGAKKSNNPNPEQKKDNPDKIIGKIGNLELHAFQKDNAINPKNILFLGNAQECFINTFINIYKKIDYKSKMRYKIRNFYNEITEYDISSPNNFDIIKIISFPFCKEENLNNKRKFLSSISEKKIDIVCYTFDKNISELNSEQKKEIEFYKYLIHFLDLRDNLIFLCDSQEELKNEELDKFLVRFNVEDNDYINDGKTYSNKIYYIINKIIYEPNDNPDNEKEWKILEQKMKEIQSLIKNGKSKSLEKGKFFKNLLNDNDKISDITIKQDFSKLSKRDQYYFIYFLGEIKLEKDKSNILITLINILRKDKNLKSIDIKENEFKFIGDKNYKKMMGVLSKISFKNLKNITFDNCELYDENTILLSQIKYNKLENLYLPSNKLEELKYILTEKIINLRELDLSNNNISDLTQFTNSKLNNLISLNLSNNNISDIECLGIKNNFDNLKILNLSNNKIKKLKIINIKNLGLLNLLDNNINEGIKEFMENNKIYSNILNLQFNNDSILFKFENKLKIEFKYKLIDNNYNKFFEELNLNGIKDIKILKSDKIRHYS